MDLNSLLQPAIAAARAAGVSILEIYETGDFSIEAKSDSSPLTLADKASHKTIVAALDKTNLPILSEEGRNIPFAERSKWPYFWMVDPLDGTKEFIKRNGEFTVNIALIHGQEVVLGVVYSPVLQEMYWAVKGQGAFLEKEGVVKQIKVSGKTQTQAGLRVVASRSHMSPETEEFIAKLENPSLVSKGSSLKLVMVAANEADIYPRFGPTMEWDTAAAQIVVEEAGGQVLQTNMRDKVKYNKEDLLNPFFIVTAF
jgi:3'(2'), 5'-bisphosphate nucleotidase